MFFYLKSAELDQIQALTAAYKSRVTVNGGEKAYIAVKMKNEKPLDLMRDVIGIMSKTAKPQNIRNE